MKMLLRVFSMRSLASIASLLLYCHHASEAHLRGATEPAENVFQTTFVQHPTGTFEPLECNAGLEQALCQPWSSMFGADGITIFNRRITIPCGQCVEIDRKIWGRDLVFYNGLDIQGRLVFPPNSHVRVKTSSILVQGELHMFSSKAINGIPAITVTWIDPLEIPPRPIAFRPPIQNRSIHQFPCGEHDYEECEIGQRPFVVAGGKVVIQGLPSPDMPTWVPLLDVDASKEGWHVMDHEYRRYPELAVHLGCPANGVLMHHVFTDAPPNYISGSWGAFTEWTGESLKVTRRSYTDHGLVIDTREIRHCLTSTTTYLLTAKVRLPRGDGLTNCATTGKDCMVLMSKYRTPNAEEKQSNRWVENESHQTEYGKDITIHAYIDFLKDEIDETNIYQIFHLRGPGPIEDMELLEFKLEVPPREAFAAPEDVCTHLVPGNGKADLFPYSAFPFRTNTEYAQIRTATENQNQYFQISGRTFILHDKKSLVDSELTERGITWSIPPSCAKAKATYRFRAKVRVHSDKPVTIEWNIRGFEANRPVYGRLASCPPSRGEWVQCNGGLITLPNNIVHSHQLDVLAETLHTFDVDYDVDDISFELIEGPVDRLILPRTIKQNWAKGAHLLITSPSPDWDAWEIVQITSISDHDEDSVKVEINRPIQSPVTAKESRHYATEVVLLSRNILFEHGSHFTILHTPGVTQTVVGADFDGWGRAGIRDSYPIHFDNCKDLDGTVVAKNTIRNSRQRGIVLHATNKVRVESNVAFNITGHCYALDSGSEHGNIFQENIGVYTRKAEVLMPQIGVSGKETDDTPATFWITNPMNSYTGNVATGSQGHGFSWQLRETPRGPHAEDAEDGPINALAMGNFENNAVHGVGASAVRVSHYHPFSEAKIVGLKVYWNDADAVEVTDSDGISIINSIFDKPLDPPTGVSVKNPSIFDVRGCSDNDEEAAAMNALVQGEAHGAIATPSAPSVFGLQEFEFQ